MSTQAWMYTFQRKTRTLNQTDSCSLVFDESIEAKNPKCGWKEYIRNPFSRFSCSSCGNRWASSKAMVVFHMQRDIAGKKGEVRVRQYKQKCKTCSDSGLEQPNVDTEAMEDMMEKLMEKILIKCYGHKDKSNTQWRKKVLKGPHLEKHCEACIKGVCTLSG